MRQKSKLPKDMELLSILRIADCCSVSLCNHKEEKTIEKLEHKFGDWEVVSGNVVIPPIVKEQECELCGYTETVKDFGYVWVTVLAVIAVIGLGVGVASYFKAFRRP